jgi:hypothetical protein
MQDLKHCTYTSWLFTTSGCSSTHPTLKSHVRSAADAAPGRRWVMRMQWTLCDAKTGDPGQGQMLPFAEDVRMQAGKVSRRSVEEWFT